MGPPDRGQGAAPPREGGSPRRLAPLGRNPGPRLWALPARPRNRRSRAASRLRRDAGMLGPPGPSWASPSAGPPSGSAAGCRTPRGAPSTSRTPCRRRRTVGPQSSPGGYLRMAPTRNQRISRRAGRRRAQRGGATPTSPPTSTSLGLSRRCPWARGVDWRALIGQGRSHQQDAGQSAAGCVWREDHILEANWRERKRQASGIGAPNGGGTLLSSAFPVQDWRSEPRL